MVGKACAKGDPVAQAVIHETLDLLAYWLGNVIDLLDPDVIVMGEFLPCLLPTLTTLERRLCEPVA